MRTEILQKRLTDLEAQIHIGRIPTTDHNGERLWIKADGSGLRFLRNLTKSMRDNAISNEIRQQAALWARAEVDGPEFSEIFRMIRDQAKTALRVA